MKKKYFKSIFKDKSFIKMICFTIVLLLVLVLGNTFGYVSADGNTSDFLNMDSYESSSVYASNNVNVRYITSDENSLIASSMIFSHDFNFINAPSGFNYDNITSYLILGSNYPSNWVIYFFEGDCHCYIDSLNKYTVLCGDSTKAYSTVVTPYGNGSTLVDPYCVFSDSLNSINLNYDTNMFYQHYLEISGSNSNVICMTNMDILTTRGLPSHNSIYQTVKDYLDGFTNTNIVNVNYLYGSAPSLQGFDNLTGVSSGEENIVDLDGIGSNMYADYADFYLNNYTGNIYHNFRDVSVCFTSNLNDYIENYLATDDTALDEYSIWLDYQVYVDFYYQTVVDYGNAGVDLSAQFANVTLGADYNHDLIFTTDYHWACNYIFEPSSTDSPFVDSGYLLSAEKFVNDNNSIFTMPFSGLFAYLTPQGGYMSSSSGSRYNTDITLYQLMDLIEDNGIIWSSNYDGLNQFKLTCTAKIIYDDGTNMASSGNYIETFNLLDGSSTVDSDSMLTNYNPSITNTDSEATLPSTSTSGTSVANSSTGNVTQTVNVSNEGAKYIPSLISNLIPTSLGDTGTGLVSTFSTMAQTNGFISVMASTVPAIPSTVWTYLTNYLGISLYLLACAFVLRLILDLL